MNPRPIRRRRSSRFNYKNISGILSACRIIGLLDVGHAIVFITGIIVFENVTKIAAIWILYSVMALIIAVAFLWAVTRVWHTGFLIYFFFKMVQGCILLITCITLFRCIGVATCEYICQIDRHKTACYYNAIASVVCTPLEMLFGFISLEAYWRIKCRCPLRVSLSESEVEDPHACFGSRGRNIQRKARNETVAASQVSEDSPPNIKEEKEGMERANLHHARLCETIP